MSIKISKNDLGENIRSRLVCPMIALDILRGYPGKKISAEMRRFLDAAKEDIIFVAELSRKLIRGVRWNQGRSKGDLEHVRKPR